MYASIYFLSVGFTVALSIFARYRTPNPNIEIIQHELSIEKRVADASLSTHTHIHNHCIFLESVSVAECGSENTNVHTDDMASAHSAKRKLCVSKEVQ